MISLSPENRAKAVAELQRRRGALADAAAGGSALPLGTIAAPAPPPGLLPSPDDRPESAIPAIAAPKISTGQAAPALDFGRDPSRKISTRSATEAAGLLRERRERRLLLAVEKSAGDQVERPAELLGGLPATRRLGARPDFLPEVAADPQGMGGVERWARESLAELGPQFRQGLDAIAFGELAYRQSMGESLTPGELHQLAAGLDAVPADTTLGAAANLAGSMAPMIGEAARGGLAGATAFGLAGAAATGGGGAIPGALAGLGFGAMSASALKSYRVNAGLAWAEFGEFRSVDGQPLDPSVRKGAAALSGVLAGGLDTVGLGKLAAAFPVLRKLSPAASRELVSRVLAKPTARDALRNFAGAYASGVVVETATETAQELIQITVGELAKVVDAGEFEAVTPDEVASRLLATAAHTARGMAVLGAFGPGLSFAVDTRRAIEADRQSRAYAALGEVVDKARARTAAPGKFAEWVESVRAAVGTVDHIQVSAEAFATYFQGQGDNPAAVASALGVGDQLADALANGDDLRVPLAAWASKVAGTPAHEGLADHIRLTPDAMTAAEARQHRLDIQEAADAIKTEADAGESSARVAILGEARAMLEAAGRSPEVAATEASIFAAFFSTMGERSGVDPLTLWRRRRPAVRRVLPEGVAGLDDSELDAILGRGSASREDKTAAADLMRRAIDAATAEDSGGLQAALEAIEAAGLEVPPLLRKLGASTQLGGDGQGVRSSPGLGNSRAFLPDGQAVDVRFEVVELSHLIASNTDDLTPNPAYPAALQPRDRTRAASGEQVSRMAGALIPELLGETPQASDGAPIVGGDNVVESGNGRILALRRAFAKGMPSADRYRRWLAGKGFDLDGFDAPVLVRRRVGEMTEGERAAFARSANVRTTASMGAAEQAAADAAALDDGLLAMIRSPDIEAASNRPFAVRFLERIAGRSELGGLIDKAGKLSLDGVRRIRGALLARAYGDMALVEKLLEEDEGGLGPLGRALLDVAPIWARLDDDTSTAPLVEAVRAVVRQRDDGNPLHFALEQSDAFSGGLSADGRAFLASFVNLDPKTGRSRLFSRVRLRQVLAAYVGEAEKQSEPAGLLGDDGGKPSPGQMLAAVNARAARELATTIEEMGLDPATVTAADLADRNQDFRDGSVPSSAEDGTRARAQDDGAADDGATLFQRDRYDTRTGDLFSFAEAGGVLSSADRDAFVKMAKREPLTDAETAGLISNGWAEPDGQSLTAAGLRVLEETESSLPPITQPEASDSPSGPLGAPQVTPREVQRTGDGKSTGDLTREAAAEYRDRLAELEAKKRPGKRQQEEAARLRRSIETMEAAAAAADRRDAELQARADQGPVYQQTGPGDPRGSISFLPGGRSLIQLFEGANLSTVLHEGAHLFLDVFGELAETSDAPAALRDDWAKLLAGLGVERRDQLGEPQHERFAKLFEVYLREGRAPSIGLQSVFARLRGWFVSVYRTVRGLGVELSDDMRGTMDRLLATDQEIAQAEAAARFDPLFVSADAGGMTEAEHRAYLEAAARATDQAAAALEREKIEAVERQTSREWKAAEARHRVEVEAEVDRRPAYAALRFFATGSIDGVDLSPALIGSKLGRELVKRDWGAEAVAALDAKRGEYKGAILRRDGVHPDDIASWLGFGSGDALVKAMITAPPRADVIEAETQRRVRVELGDALAPENVAKAAQEAVHGDARAAFLMLELKALSAKVGAVSMPLQVIKAAAARAVGRETVRDLMGHDRHLYQSQRHAKEAARWVAKGDFRRATEAKRRQLFHFAAWQEARRRHRKVETSLERWRRIGRGSAGVKLPAEYRDQALALLERFDIRRASRAQVAKRAALADWIKSQEDLGLQVDIDERLRSDAMRRHYSELSADDFQLLADAIAQIEHLGRLKGKLLAAQDAASFEDAVAEVVDSIETNHEGAAVPPLDFGARRGETAKRALRRILASHRKVEFVLERLDGHKLGPVWRRLFLPFVDAEKVERDHHERISEGLAAAFGRYSRKERTDLYRKRLHVPELGASFSKAALISLALNWGNDGNRRAVLVGYKWREADVQRVLDRELTAKDWRVVQDVWALVDSFWPAIEALQKDLTGRAPPKVEARKVSTAAGEIEGGYYPLVFDGEQSHKVSAREEAQSTAELFGGNWSKPATRKGHTIARVGSGGLPVKLDLSVLPRHVAQVAKDLSHRRAVIDTMRLISDKRVVAAIEAAAGRETYRLLRPWLQQIAAPAYDPGTGLEGVLARARVGVTVVNMGLKVTTMLAQPLGILTTFAHVGPRWTLEGLGRVYGLGPLSLITAKDFAFGRSPELQRRARTFDRDVNDTVRRMTRAGTLKNYQAAWFYFVGVFDMAVALPTWIGAYHKALAADPTNERAAAEAADSAVRMSQSAGGAKDLAAVQSGGELMRLFTAFYSYFSVLYNQFERSISSTDFKRPRDYPRFAGQMLALWLAPALLGELIAGRGPDEDEEWHTWAAKHLAMYPAQSMVLLRDVVSATLGDYGYQMAPAGDALGSLAKALGDLMEGDSSRGAIYNGAMAVSTWAALPGRQIWITGEFFFDWLVHDADPESVGQALRYMLLQRKPPDERP